MQEFPIIIIFFIAFYVRSYVLEFSFSATTHQRKHLGDYDRFAIFLWCLYVKFSEAIMLNVQAADYELRDSPLIAFNGMSSFFFFLLELGVIIETEFLVKLLTRERGTAMLSNHLRGTENEYVSMQLGTSLNER